MAKTRKRSGPKVLIFDIETAPILGYVWGMYDQNVALNQIHKDWFVLSWAAKWLDSKEVMYMDSRLKKNPEKDKHLLKSIWQLLDEADIVVTQNGVQFDTKKLNARFIINGFKKPSSYKHVDTLILARKHFGFTSNKLEYMTDKLCKIKKLVNRKFSGFDLWKECLKGNKKAWREMERYNKRDVLALEELYLKLRSWDNTVMFRLYDEKLEDKCDCGGIFWKNGKFYKDTGIFQRYRCVDCGAESKGRTNLLSKTQVRSLKSK